MAFCTNCGEQIKAGARFCANCGISCDANEESIRRKVVYEGEIHKCPNCGEILNSFTANCPLCGCELRGARAVSSVKEFIAKIEKIEQGRTESSVKQITKTDEQKISLIRNFPIPNTKEDLYEFLILAKSNVQIDAYDSVKIRSTDARLVVSDAWKAKFEQAYEKAKLVFEGDSRLNDIKMMYDETHKSIHKSRWKSWKMIGIFLSVYFGVSIALCLGVLVILALMFVFVNSLI